MAANFKTVRVLLNNSVGTQDISIAGFGTPKAAMFFYGIGESNDTIRASLRVSEGYTDGTNQAASSSFSLDGQATSATGRINSSNSVIIGAGVSASSPSVKASFSQWITDGVQINITAAASAPRYLTVVLINGSDVLNAAVVTTQLTSTSNVISSLSFEPSYVYLNSIGLNSVNGATSNSISLFSSGIAINDGSDSNCGQLCYDSDNASTTNAGQYTSNTYSVGQFFSGSLSWGGSVGSYTANGFTITTTASPGNDYISFLAIELGSGAQIKIVSHDSPTSTGNHSFTGAGFTPTYAMLMGGNATAYNSPSNSFTISTFNSDDTNQSTSAFSSLDSQASSVAKSISKSGGIVQLNGNSKQFESTFTGFTSDGMDHNFTTVDGSARKWAAFYIGAQSSGVSIIETTTNTNYTSLDPTIELTSSISITESTVNTNYTSLDPVIDLTGSISIVEQTVNTDYTSLDPVILLSGTILITEQTVNTNYTSLDPIINSEVIIQSTFNGFIKESLFDGSLENTSEFTGALKSGSINGIINESISYSGYVRNSTFKGIL